MCLDKILTMPKCKPKSIVTYFTAVVVFSTLMLVCYDIMLSSSAYQHKLSHQRKISSLNHKQDFSSLSNKESEQDGQYSDLDDPLYPSRDQSRQKNILPVKSPAQALQKLKFSKTFRPILNLTHLTDSQPLKRNLLSKRSLNLNKNGPLQTTKIQPHALSHRECVDKICSGYLSDNDLARFLSCDQSVRNASAIPYNGDCQFMDGEGRNAVALVSLPGSGNTWVRGLLQTATGICTGAVYCDISLRATGFTGEFVRSGSTLVVKTHENVPIWVGARFPRYLSENRGRYGSAIFIMRSPFRALIAEWNRKVANNFHSRTIHLDSHIKIVGQEWFGEFLCHTHDHLPEHHYHQYEGILKYGHKSRERCITL